MVNLTHSVNLVAKEIISVVTAVPRLRIQNFSPEATDDTPTPAGDDKYRPYYDTISEDSDILRVVVASMNGMSSSATELQKYLSYWDKYRSLWEMDKEFYFRKYAKANRNPQQFDVTISGFKHQQGDIQSESSNHNINFVRVDCNTLKDSLVNHCLQCQNRLTGLLNQNGSDELKSIYDLFKDSSDKLVQSPNDLDELSYKIGLCKQLKDDKEVIRARFDPVREIYDTLTKFEVVVKDEELTELNDVDEAFDDFCSMLFNCERMLEKSKVSMKKNLESQLDQHGENMVELRSTAQVGLPFSADKSPEVALAAIAEYNLKVEKSREHEAHLAKGLAIFGIEPKEHEDLTATAKDLQLLGEIWTVTVEWKKLWDGWSEGKFDDLDTDAMENVAGGYTKKVGKLGREIKRWKVWEAMKGELDKFREVIPIIQDLRNKALRARHWTSLKQQVGHDFDQEGADFTLDKVVKLGFLAHSDFISEMSGNANKEYLSNEFQGQLKILQ
jgi:dynein heavy chain